MHYYQLFYPNTGDPQHTAPVELEKLFPIKKTEPQNEINDLYQFFGKKQFIGLGFEIFIISFEFDIP